MIARLRAAGRALFGMQAPDRKTCVRCADQAKRIDELVKDVTYWREREERTADAFFAAKGAHSIVASPPKPKTRGPMELLAMAATQTEFDSTKSRNTAGQGDVTGGHREH